MNEPPLEGGSVGAAQESRLAGAYQPRGFRPVHDQQEGIAMNMKFLGLLGAASLTMTVPFHSQAADQSVDVKQLQEENRRLAEQLRTAQDKLKKYEQAPAQTAASSSQPREMNAPLPLTPAEQAGAIPTSTTPASAGQKDFLVAIGTKIWMTEWNTWRTPAAIERGQNIQSLTSTSSSEVSPIPTLTFKYKDFFLTGSYLAETDYQFPSQSFVSGVDSLPATLNYRLSGSRREWDFSLGYQIIPYLAATVGYKEINQKFRQQECQASVPGLSEPCTTLVPGFSLNSNVTYGGPTLGLSGAAPIGYGVGLYGNFTYGWLGANYNASETAGGDDGVGDVDYYVGELGLTYTHLMKEMPVYMPLSAATAYAGYRYQTYESQLRGGVSNGNNPKDVVQGFVAGINLSF